MYQRLYAVRDTVEREGADHQDSGADLQVAGIVVQNPL